MILICFQSLYKPLVDKLGYDYSDEDSADTKQLRTLVVAGAANADEPSCVPTPSLPRSDCPTNHYCSVVKELQERFAGFMKTGDDSAIALDLERATFTTSVKHGGRAEYEAIKKIFQKPKTPQTRVSVLHAFGARRICDMLRLF